MNRDININRDIKIRIRRETGKLGQSTTSTDYFTKSEATDALIQLALQLDMVCITNKDRRAVFSSEETIGINETEIEKVSQENDRLLRIIENLSKKD